VLVAPLTRHGGRPAQLVSISNDVTAHVKAGADKDLLMQEIHHRVKNSLHLVQALLGIQGRAAADEGVARQLAESAARVRTIAALHDRLYRTAGTLDVEIGPYLDGLVADLRAGMASTLADRAIRLHADAATWPAKDVTTLGLVLTELVTNALKYGRGAVGVTFRQASGEQAVLTVDDEGSDLPEDFQPSNSRGLGMRLVTGLVGERGGSIRVDRSAGHTRFVAVMPRAQDGADG
jgi:two-component sensor histidine kinase